jgi:hypothetical protein
VNLALDLLVRSGRLDEAKAWAREQLADEAFLENKPVLRATLERMVRADHAG